MADLYFKGAYGGLSKQPETGSLSIAPEGKAFAVTLSNAAFVPALEALKAIE